MAADSSSEISRLAKADFPLRDHRENGLTTDGKPLLNMNNGQMLNATVMQADLPLDLSTKGNPDLNIVKDWQKPNPIPMQDDFPLDLSTKGNADLNLVNDGEISSTSTAMNPSNEADDQTRSNTKSLVKMLFRTPKSIKALTEKRKLRIIDFLENTIRYPELYLIYGEEKWTQELIKSLPDERKGTRKTKPTDVQHWLCDAVFKDLLDEIVKKKNESRTPFGIPSKNGVNMDVGITPGAQLLDSYDVDIGISKVDFLGSLGLIPNAVSTVGKSDPQEVEQSPHEEGAQVFPPGSVFDVNANIKKK